VVDRHVTWGAVAAVVALLAACAAQVGAPPPEIVRREPADFVGAYYRQLLAHGKPVFRVDPTRSLVVIEVRRGGSLAQLGHDHVIASHDVAGYIAPDEGRADVYLPLDALVVDEPALRAEAGFDTQPTPADIAGTRSNMLEKVLETARYPYASIAVNESMAADGARQLKVAVTLHGTTQFVDATTQSVKTQGEIFVQGAMAMDQSTFGIAPFSVLGGAIAVQDRVNITFRIRARRME
jgi:hypothetical protein